MCCLAVVLMMIGPRAAILVWWLMDPLRWKFVYAHFFWPLLGFLFLPWTTLAYVVVAPGGVEYFDWVLIAVSLLADVTSYGGGAYSRRDQHGYGQPV
ncbi:MAG: hypothetical protein ABFS21_10690 [Actinomycetota bacterium]